MHAVYHSIVTPPGLSPVDKRDDMAERREVAAQRMRDASDAITSDADQR